jgi:hypothetical protein
MLHAEMCAWSVDQLLLELRKHEEKLRAWIDLSEDNAVLFVQDPAAALRAADLGMPEDTIMEFEEVLQAIEAKLCQANTASSVLKHA